MLTTQCTTDVFSSASVCDCLTEIRATVCLKVLPRSLSHPSSFSFSLDILSFSLNFSFSSEEEEMVKEIGKGKVKW